MAARATRDGPGGVPSRRASPRRRARRRRCRGGTEEAPREPGRDAPRGFRRPRDGIRHAPADAVAEVEGGGQGPAQRSREGGAEPLGGGLHQARRDVRPLAPPRRQADDLRHKRLHGCRAETNHGSAYKGPEDAPHQISTVLVLWCPFALVSDTMARVSRDRLPLPSNACSVPLPYPGRNRAVGALAHEHIRRSCRSPSRSRVRKRGTPAGLAPSSGRARW